MRPGEGSHSGPHLPNARLCRPAGPGRPLWGTETVSLRLSYQRSGSAQHWTADLGRRSCPKGISSGRGVTAGPAKALKARLFGGRWRAGPPATRRPQSDEAGSLTGLGAAPAMPACWLQGPAIVAAVRLGQAGLWMCVAAGWGEQETPLRISRLDRDPLQTRVRALLRPREDHSSPRGTTPRPFRQLSAPR